MAAPTIGGMGGSESRSWHNVPGTVVASESRRVWATEWMQQKCLALLLHLPGDSGWHHCRLRGHGPGQAAVAHAHHPRGCGGDRLVMGDEDDGVAAFAGEADQDV